MYPIEEMQEDGSKKIKNIPLLKYINVFHVTQVDGVAPLAKKELHHIAPIKKAEKILSDYWSREHIRVEHISDDKAFYNPMRDLIQLPLLGQFKRSEDYYSTAFHESVHSTMAEWTYTLYTDVKYSSTIKTMMSENGTAKNNSTFPYLEL